LLNTLHESQNIALVTDAGMPLISDPGYELVTACIESGISVVPIPGATAVITALTAAGLPTDRFVFEGFLPVMGKDRQKRLEYLSTETRTFILYESPHRLKETLQDLASCVGKNRRIVIARELTKLYEEFWRGGIAEAIAHYSQQEPKGEFTLVVAGAGIEMPILSEAELKVELLQIMAQGVSRSQASRQLAQLTKINRQKLYKLALSLPTPPQPQGDTVETLETLEQG
jgi:16S rRNA (cytidine1402-2'-O)-methyltransferase